MREGNEGWNEDTLGGMRTLGGAGAEGASVAEEARSLGGLETRMGTGIEDDGRTDAARRWKAGETILGRYVVEGELGQGGMGVVYACLDKVGGVRVAVKCLPPELSHNSVEMEEVRENFQLVYGLSHPNIAAVKTLERDGKGEYFLVMDVAEGESLRSWMRRKLRSGQSGTRGEGGGLPVEEVVPVLRQVAAALDYAHGERVVHRDVKPGNVMIDGRGRVKVLDFGLAAQIRTSLSRASQAYRGTSGTGPYMAPEQWEGKQQDGKADQYALGVMAYEMLSGHLPFENSELAVLREAVLKGAADSIQGLPKGAMGALRRAMAKRKEERFGSCGEFVEALAGGSGRRNARGKTLMGWVAVLVLAAAVGAGVWWGGGGSGETRQEGAIPNEGEMPAPPEEDVPQEAEQKTETKQLEIKKVFEKAQQAEEEDDGAKWHISASSLPPAIALLRETDADHIDAALQSLRPNVERLTAVAPVLFAQQADGTIPVTPLTDLMPFRMFCAYNRLRLIPVVALDVYSDIVPSTLIDIILKNHLSGLILLVRTPPPTEWYEQFTSLLEMTTADLIVLQSQDAFWGEKATRPLNPVSLREIQHDSLLLQSNTDTWSIYPRFYPAQLPTDRISPPEPLLLVIPAHDDPPLPEDLPNDPTLVRPASASESVSDSWDSDGDGLPDKVEQVLGLDPLDSSDAQSDLDGDGFTNVEEFCSKTDPDDAASFPDPVVKLRVASIKAVPFYLRFNGVNVLRGDRMVFQLNLQSADRTYFVKTGDIVDGYKVMSYDPYGRDGATLLLQRVSDSHEVRLVHGTPVTENDLVVTFVWLVNRTGLPPKRLNENFEFNGKTYKVEDIRPNWGVIIEETASGRKMNVPRLSEVESTGDFEWAGNNLAMEEPEFVPMTKSGANSLGQENAQNATKMAKEVLAVDEVRCRQTSEDEALRKGTEEARVLREEPTAAMAGESSLSRKMLMKMQNIIFPKLEFLQADIVDIVNYLVEASIAADPTGEGVNIVLHLGDAGVIGSASPASSDSFDDKCRLLDDEWDFGAPDWISMRGISAGISPITLNHRNVSLADSIKLITEVAGLKYRVDDAAVVIMKKDVPVDDTLPTVVSQAMFAKMQNIVIPKLEFRQANIADVVGFLSEVSIEGDPHDVGVHIVLNLDNTCSHQHPISLNLRNVSLADAIKYIAELADLNCRVEDEVVIIAAKDIANENDK